MSSKKTVDTDLDKQHSLHAVAGYAGCSQVHPDRHVAQLVGREAEGSVTNLIRIHLRRHKQRPVLINEAQRESESFFI